MKVGFLDILGIVFVVLKLTETIAWSWWLVLLPFYIVPAVVLGLMLIGGIIAAVGDKK